MSLLSSSWFKENEIMTSFVEFSPKKAYQRWSGSCLEVVACGFNVFSTVVSLCNSSILGSSSIPFSASSAKTLSITSMSTALSISSMSPLESGVERHLQRVRISYGANDIFHTRSYNINPIASRALFGEPHGIAYVEFYLFTIDSECQSPIVDINQRLLGS